MRKPMVGGVGVYGNPGLAPWARVGGDHDRPPTLPLPFLLPSFSLPSPSLPSANLRAMNDAAPVPLSYRLLPLILLAVAAAMPTTAQITDPALRIGVAGGVVVAVTEANGNN